MFAVINSILFTFAFIIVFTAFPPAPPIPITVILGLISLICSGIDKFNVILFSLVVNLFHINHKFWSNHWPSLPNLLKKLELSLSAIVRFSSFRLFINKPTKQEKVGFSTISGKSLIIFTG